MEDSAFKDIPESCPVNGEKITVLCGVKDEKDPEIVLKEEVRWLNQKVLNLEKRVRTLERKQKWGLL